jgi:hypothetical protein
MSNFMLKSNVIKSCAIALFLTCTGVSFCQAQTNNTDRYGQSKIFINDHQTGRLVPTKSDAAMLFKNAFINLAKSNIKYREAAKTAHDEIFYRVTQINHGFPATRNDGTKLYNGFQLIAFEGSDNYDRPIVTFIYDMDGNALYCLDPVHTHKFSLQSSYNQDYLKKCVRYCKFNN